MNKTKRLLSFLLFVCAMATEAWSQTAIVVRDSEPVAIFYGTGSLTSAVNYAEASGDVIMLSSGTFSNPGEIKKAVSIYGKGHEGTNRTYIQGKLQYRSNGAGSLDNIHLEGLYLENHFNLLNDNDRNPINDLTVVKCHVTGMFLYMNSNNVTLRNCIIQGDLKTYPSSFTTTSMLIENCWKDGGSFNIFTEESTITVRNSIFNFRSLSGFDASRSYAKATFENCVLSNCILGANSTVTNCVMVDVTTTASGLTTTDCWTVTSSSDIFDNATSCVYSEGTCPQVKSQYVGTDGTPVGITGGAYPWNVTPASPSVNLSTTLVKDGNGYYKIGTVADWVELKRVVETYEPDAKAKMTADIDLGDEQAMIGNGDYNIAANRRPFMGIFDGQGHTLTIHYNTSDWEAKTYLGAAPFGYVMNGTIRNLNIAGTLTATQEGVAGLIGWTNGKTLIERCHSSVEITYINGARGAAGLTYNSYGDNHVLTIRDCIYDGTLTAGTNKTGAAGFVVYRGSGTVNIYNSLQAASYGNGMGSSDCATFVRNPNGIISNSYYKTVLNTPQGMEATADELANGRTAFYLQNGREELFWGQKIGTDPMPVLTNDESRRVYRSATGYTNNPSLAIADQSLIPLTYTRNSNNELTITGFDPGFTPPENYTLAIPKDIDGAPVVAIGNKAFSSRTEIAAVEFPATVKTLGEEAFRNCSGLTAVTIPATITSMGANVFWNSGVKTADVYCTVMGQGTFYQCASLESVTINQGVTTLGLGAFHGCSKLASVTIPKTVTTMLENVFRECTLLASVTFENGIQIETIPNNAFYYDQSLPSISIPASVKTISTQAFRNCSGLTAVSIPSNSQLTTINNSAFSDCVLLPSFTMPGTLTTLGTSVFYNCSKLTSVTFSDQLLAIPDGTFQRCSLLNNVTIPRTITRLGSNAFRECTSLTSIVIPNTVTAMGSSVFEECTALTSASFESGFTMNYIPDRTFYNTRFSSFTIPASVQTINARAFMNNTALAAINFPATVKTLGEEAFHNCSGLTAVTIPATITSMGANVFWNSGVKTADVYCTVMGQGTFYQCASLESVTINQGVTTLGLGAFHGCSKLASVTIPKTVTTMLENVFRECTLLASVTFENGIQIETIPNNAFYYDVSLTGITLPASVTTIGNSAFRYCEKLDNLVLHGNLTSIQDWSFANCTALENLTVEEGVTSINRDVFQFCGLKNVVLPSTLDLIGVNLFHQCNALETLDLSKCVNVWELYNMTSIVRTGGSGQWNIFFGVPATTKVIMPPYANVEPSDIVEVDKESFNLTKDGEGYYLIKNASDWDKFVAYSRANPDINGRLTADINLKGHAGKLGVGNGESNYITYKGTLDGQGHKLTINYRSGKDVSGGVLAYVEEAVVKNLKVSGTIAANNRLIGGFVGFVKTALTMQDCESEVNVTVKPTTTNMHIAGFIGQGKQGTITLTDCLFKGSVTGKSSFRYAAPFLGWKESAGTITYNYCLNNGTFTNTDQNYTYALGVTQSNGQSTSVACFYKEGNITNNESLATPTTADRLASGQIACRLQGERTEQHWGQLIGTDPAPVLTNDAAKRVYRSLDGYSNTPDEGDLVQDTEGYYLIGNVDDWKRFAMYVDEGFTDMNVRMTNDIDLGNVQTMIGSGPVATDNNGSNDIKFQGIFDGQGHTLTIHYVAAESTTAPFRYIQNATIKNLRVTGTIKTAYAHAGGIVGCCFGQQIHSYITNCYSSVRIISTYVNTGDFYGGAMHGGIAARLHYYGQLHITDCIFDGSISGENRGVVWGGFMGIPDGTVTITNSLQTGTFNCSGVIGGNNGSGTFSTLFGNGYASRVNISNCYYVNQIGNAQGTKATTTTLSDGTVTTALQAGRDEVVWIQDGDHPMLALFEGSTNVATGIHEITGSDAADTWYNMSGVKLDEKPTQPGVYVRGGKKVVVK